MTLEAIFSDKTMRSKAKVVEVGGWLLDGSLSIHELLAFTENQKGANKGNCIEVIEYATKQNPSLTDVTVLDFVVKTLKDKEPRVKWESAKVIGNIAKLYPENLSTAIANLLKNTKSEGTVVRWATALALGEILKLKTEYNEKLLPKIEKLAENEIENGVKKKYLGAIKKVKQ